MDVEEVQVLLSSRPRSALSRHRLGTRPWQDYGYWYGEKGVGGPFPDMVIAGVAIDPAMESNGW